MRTLMLVLFLVGCGGTVEETEPTSTDAGIVDAGTPAPLYHCGETFPAPFVAGHPPAVCQYVTVLATDKQTSVCPPPPTSECDNE